MLKFLNYVKSALVAALAIGSMPAHADYNLPAGGVQVFLPAELAKPLISEKTTQKLLKSGNWGQSQSNTHKYWTAYSDRADNKTYASPSTSSQAVTKLQFNEKVRIAKIENGFALVYSEPKAGVEYPQISNKAVKKGWVPMSNLLLWESCPVNENDIYQKALLVANIDKIQKGDRSPIGSYYYSPDRTHNQGGIKTDMTIYFIMKRNPNTGMVLLSTQNKLSGLTDKVLYGWVNENSYTPWNQRSCLEPTWDVDHVQQLGIGKAYKIYADANLTEEGSSYTNGKENPDDKTPSTKYRRPKESVRFPILDNDTKNKNIYKITSFAYNHSVDGEDQDKYIKLQKEIERLSHQLQNINLIFVIDGTRSMKKYFESVRSSLKEGLAYFDKAKYKPRVGVVIYRDHADGNAKSEIQPLVEANDPRLISFLSNIGTLGYGAASSPNDHTHTEAMYDGINEALDGKKMGFTPDDANLMIIIGDCGNPTDDDTRDKLIKKLIDNNVHLMAYQVLRSEEEPWQLFNIQTGKLIAENMIGQYKKINSKPDFSKHPNGTGYDLKRDGKNPFIGSIRRANEQGKAMDPSALSRLIEQSIGDFSQAIQTQIDMYNVTGFAEGDVNASDLEISKNFLTNRVGQEYADILGRGDINMTFTGYVPKQSTERIDYFKPVVFLSSDELNNLIKRLQPVYDASERITNDRRPYIDAVKGLLQAMLPDITNDELNDMDIAEASKRIAGLNESSAATKTHTLAELQDSRTVPNHEFQILVNDFITKFKGLRNIATHPYKYSYEKNGTRYYWIPVENLP